MDVEFKDLSYTIKRISWRSKAPGKQILKSVSGRFKSGALSAIMGPSGAGKSSLLNALSGFRTGGVTGVLTHNGKPRDSRLFHKLSCYITQEDLLQPLLTVQEAMMAAAFLKLPAHTSNKIRRSKVLEDTLCVSSKPQHPGPVDIPQQIWTVLLSVEVEEILATLGLSETANTRTEHLSGGQRKRLSIALELINNPPIFFLDEPTSGLDNVTTRQCLQLLRTLASQGRTIVCTIHQPSASLFQMFDHVYVVAQGCCVYQGSSKDLVPFLSSTGLSCPMHYNPADFVIEVTDANEKNILALSTAIENGKLSWAGTPVKQKEPSLSSLQITDDTSLAENAKLAVRANGTGTSSPAVSGDTSSEGSSVDLGTTYHRMNQLKNLEYPTSTWFQFCALMRRMLLQHSRNKLAIQLQMIHHVLCALFFGIVTYQSANDGHEMFKHVKFLTGVILFHAYTWCMAPVLLYPKEVKLMKKEYFNRWYNLTSFYFASMISKIPLMVMLTLIFVSLVYFLNGLPAEPYRFFCFFVIAMLTSLVAEGLGMAIGATFNITNGCAVGPMVVAPFLGLAIYGFDFADQIPWLMYCLMKTSFMRCGIVGLVLTVYGLDRQDLNCDDIYCHFMKPKVVLRMLDIDKVSVWQEIAALVALMVFFRAFCYCALRRRLVT